MPGTFRVNCNESELDMIMIIGYTIAELCQTDNRIGF